MMTTEQLETTYYQILGVEQNATLSEIERAYRELSSSLRHPDPNTTIIDTNLDSEQLRQLSLVREAYQILKDTDQRTQYDRVLAGEEEDQEHTNRSGVHERVLSRAISGEQRSIRDDFTSPPIMDSPEIGDTVSLVELVKNQRNSVDYLLLFCAYGVPALTCIGVCLYIILNSGR